MKAADLWAGHDYAYFLYKPNKVETPKNAKRVKVVRIQKHAAVGYGRERGYTEVEVDFLNSETGQPTGTRSWVRARDIVDWWDEYENRLEAIKERENEEERLRQDRIKSDQERKGQIITQLANVGIPEPDKMVTEISTYTVSFSRNRLERWLGIDGEES